MREGRQSHAYLFSGPRGTGKTSTARVLAKALNCENLTDGEPCTTCDSCQAIEHGTSFDLHELDAASNNKVDDIRDLIAKVALGSPGRTKVYILDEVHMLSSGAENALLKTLEEPPDHVVFVLATTEPHKVVDTIRSRTQAFEFRLLPAEELTEHVRWIIEDASLDVDQAGIDFALRKGGGSARDTLSALDLVAAAGGVPEQTDIGQVLADAIGAGDSAAAIAGVQRALEAGREPRVIGETTLATLRDAFLASMGAPLDQLSESAAQTAQRLAGDLGAATITRSLEMLGQALVEMRQAPDPRVPLEVALLRLARREGNDTAALLQRIEALESHVAALSAGGVVAGPAQTAPPAAQPAAASAEAPAAAPAEAPTAAPAPAPAPAAAPAPTGPPSQRQASPPPPRSPRPPQNDAPAPAAAASEPPAAEAPAAAAPEPAPAAAPPPSGAPLDNSRVMAEFADILAGVSQKVRSKFRLGQVLGVSGNQVQFGLPNSFGLERCEAVKAEMEDALSRHYGQAVVIDLQLDGGATPPPVVEAPKPAAEVPAPSVEEQAADVGDLSELTDAGDTASTGIDRLTEAFPGAEIVEPRE